MSKHVDNVPAWIRVMVGFFAIVTIFTGVKCYLNPGQIYGNAADIAIGNILVKETAYEIAAIYLSLGLAMGFVTIIRGAPEALVILTIIRALTEIQAIVVYVAMRDIHPSILTSVILLLVEIWMIKTLVIVIKKEEDE